MEDSQEGMYGVLLPLVFLAGTFTGIFLFFVLDDVFDVLWWYVLDFLPDDIWWWLRTL